MNSYESPPFLGTFYSNEENRNHSQPNTGSDGVYAYSTLCGRYADRSAKNYTMSKKNFTDKKITLNSKNDLYLIL